MQGVLGRILEHGSCKLFRISINKTEYERFQRTLTGDNKMSDLSPEMINHSLMADTLTKISKSSEVYLIHDPSDIRKPHSSKTENLGKVRDLNGHITNGYSSYNIVAVTPKSKTVQLLSHRSYSNKDPNFLKLETIKKLEEGKKFEGEEAARKLYESDRYFNKKSISKEMMIQVSSDIKSALPDMKITHIFDREFDDDDYHRYVADELKDDFVARAKKSRTIPDSQDETGKKVKLIESDFKHNHTFKIQKIKFKRSCFQDVTLQIEWNDYIGNQAVRITVKDQKGKNIFQDPMLLITNKPIESPEDAFLIYTLYLKRSKIEYVFKFLKEGLGWEEIQLRDFKGIQNLLSICFFVAAYLYEIGEQVAQDDYSILFAEIGGGKGVISRHFILEGIKKLVAKYHVDQVLKKHQVPEETIEGMQAMAGMDLC